MVVVINQEKKTLYISVLEVDILHVASLLLPLAQLPIASGERAEEVGCKNGASDPAASRSHLGYLRFGSVARWIVPSTAQDVT